MTDWPELSRERGRGGGRDSRHLHNPRSFLRGYSRIGNSKKTTFKHSSAMPPIRQTTLRRTASNQSARGTSASRIEIVRAGIQQLFSGRSSVGTRSSSPESPKTPRLALGLNNLSSTRLNIPFLTRTNTTDRSTTSPSSPSARSPTTPISSRPITRNALREHELSNVSAIPPPLRHNSNQRFAGVDPAERELAELAYIGRRRRNRTSKERRCAPKIKNQKIRANILKCFISGMVNLPHSKLHGQFLMVDTSF